MTELGWERCEHEGEGSTQDDSRFLTCLVGWKVVLTKQGSIREDTVCREDQGFAFETVKYLRHKKCGRWICVSRAQDLF